MIDAEAVTDLFPSADGELSYRPALVRFVEDATTEIERFRSEGYRDRRDLIEGLHRLIFYSLGRVRDDWYARAARQRVLLTVLITGPEREHWNRHDIAPETARAERRQLAATYVRPAMRAAFRELRTEADEHVGVDESAVDPDELSHFAARPALDELFVRQRGMLRDFLDGFETRAELDRWADRLDLATYGEHETVVTNWDRQLATNHVEERVLLDQIEHAAREREHQAARILLPAFNRAVPIVLARSKELREDADTEHVRSKSL